MKNIAIVACRKVREQTLCPGDTRCLIAFARREGEFSRYDDAKIVGIVDCGECPGSGVLLQIAAMNSTVLALGEKIDAIHIGKCITSFCPYREDMIKSIKEKVSVEVVEGTHPYLPNLP